MHTEFSADMFLDEAYTTKEAAEAALKAATDAGAKAFLLELDPNDSWLAPDDHSKNPIGWGVTSNCGEWMLAPSGEGYEPDSEDPEFPSPPKVPGYIWYCVV